MLKESDEDRITARMSAFRQQLSAQGVPHAVYPEYPSSVLVNIGGDGVPYQGFVQCWIEFAYKDAVEIRLLGGDALMVRPGRSAEAFEAINSINGKEWWATAHADEDGRVGLTATFWLDDTSCGKPLYCLMRDVSQVMLKYADVFA